jgi:hypothetical protein
MREMLTESRPDDLTGRSGTGVELWTGADYAVAKALERRELGHVEGPGQSAGMPGMYWSNGEGLAARADLVGEYCSSGEIEPCPCSRCRAIDDY